MDENKDIHINEQRHKKVPSLSERTLHALAALLFGFILINIIAFWMFPGIGLGGFYLVFSAHSITSSYGSLLNIFIITLLVLFALFGWFQGKHFIGNLRHYINWWRFW